MEDQNLEFEYSENKIDQALKLYDTELNDEQVAKEVTTLLKKHLKENDTNEVKQLLLNSATVRPWSLSPASSAIVFAVMSSVFTRLWRETSAVFLLWTLTIIIQKDM